MSKISQLSFFFPAYNEEANVAKTIQKAQQILPEIAVTWEIIPVNDGSRDKTKEIIDQLAQSDPHLHPVHHEKNSGYGAALISGFQAAQYEWIFFTDGDLQFDLREISSLIERCDEGDLILGYRRNRQDPWNRKLNAKLWGSLVKFLFGFQVRDVDCAFKLIKKNVFKKIQLHARGAMISTELLACAYKEHFRFVEVPVTHYPRQAGSPTGAKLSVIFKAFQELFRLYKQLK
jgi:glycosyltransferase involved in cell wall biosynthesis